ncbi:DNA topoisomerase I [Candidatus Giovannonibacteria bacterium RIFCSPLOWO2_12_FULL_43_11c]|uniref:DNA topoisomerase 1 n=1 Tax=Candidatus Giovannonibacteria bacterium RIFCSPHIGHO2_12_FULL_43_15 TaxID=1798341 RepID=A0A1F5WQY0_9BACT|nr:MAG: DNA topoisomerase I [Candidatus Giovannonibacteria bacterium RIFCSPHIGHO2_01_FULL_43_100]OGF66111.1 MAG: DNA topoisomerase I [Candidatus Giovannonibacteria bacterium RIFCSPHIGHO2_02_FULL_43_32]OGF78069.1 MAG: DNA topoisomerase I [Candidatus Giovannonibacteria bacterium RIFCSPHIGHO2_12_FULL_43_15]OGF78806.1 MAG: DNA topoisomerase I [Candidatus Giovannonibacteria bacterium RIFCSPLOWO2_01_FULL_43_60]OGF92371.1 MAG: DNA topoisomerase I [Candidatus Giovannonibacteria bacterium RIFCSPLOWO2_12
MKLIIVESPTKAKTISGFVPSGFKVLSSYGHVRDLPKSALGIDEESFEPKYVIPTAARKKVNILKKEVEKMDAVILATDEDREGEAIAWHLTEALSLRNLKVDRIVFHEITKSAIDAALKTPRDIDLKLVDAQQARRILDRLVGYKLSPFLWKKLYRGLSAGRVQSVAVRLIVEREREIRSFAHEEYWSIGALLAKKDGKGEFEAFLSKKNGNALDKFAIKNKGDAEKIAKDLENKEWVITSIEKKETIKNSSAPFTTSTLQQEAFRRLGFSVKQTMLLAQQLYEGIYLGEKGASGLITYMRTDSLNVAESALTDARNFLEAEFGKDYALPSPRRFKTKSKGAQEAHEAIRPTDPSRSPNSIKSFLDKRQLKLYELIWRRFVASQMPQAIFDSTSADINAGEYTFRANGQTMKFDGFLKIYPIKFAEAALPELSEEEKLNLEKLNPLQHFTEPPPRYTEASLIKILEKNGIGRPSTYAPIISTIQSRNYVQRDDKKRLGPTEVGFLVNDMLVENFPEVVDIQFTAKMEEELDEIASGEIQWKNVVKDFYTPFSKHLAEKYESVEKRDFQETTDEKCEKCGKPMVIKRGRFGRFMACSGFPECKNAKPLPPVSLNIKCLKCHEGEIVERSTKRGKMFYGCSLWPKCDFASWLKPTGDLCPECSSPLVQAKNSIKCSSKSCIFEGKEIEKKE